MLYHYSYVLLVLVVHPSIPLELKALGSNQFAIREAALDRLESLPGWTALYFEPYSRKAKDLEIRTRCMKVYNTLNKKLDHEIQMTRILFRRLQLKAATIRAWEERTHDVKKDSKSSKEKR